MTSNYQFLEMLHRELKPRGYLEIGVRHGDSLRLAQCQAIGIDPDPQAVKPSGSNFGLLCMTSDEFFETVAFDEATQARHTELLPSFDMDLVYIDGYHSYEQALRDFVNVVQYANDRTVVVFDDTHPYNQAIATRTQPPGDWTGDVWKTMELIQLCMDYGSMREAQVDVSPTGAFVVWNIRVEFNIRERFAPFHAPTNAFMADMPVPEEILDRRNAFTPEEAIQQILRSR